MTKIAEGAVPCKKCGGHPVIEKINDLYYVQCRGKYTNQYGETRSCDRWLPYQFLGLSEKSAVENWNCFNDKTIRRNDIDDLLD